jgi:hypothetical protein
MTAKRPQSRPWVLPPKTARPARPALAGEKSMIYYPLAELEKDIDVINGILREIRANKGHDYSNEKDTFENLRSFGSLGVAVRIGDKFPG